MQKVDPLKIKGHVLTKHLGTMKALTKSFTDSSEPDYKECSPYAAFIAWGSQFSLLCGDASQENKCARKIAAYERDLDMKASKKATIESILDNFNKDGYTAFFQ